jgi:periplasmic divalent cation tolerance protein
MKYLEISTTTAKRADAERIANVLVRERLAACVHVLGPARSTHRWKGKMVNAEEWLCLIKTERAHYKKVERRRLQIHPYELPEIAAVPYIAGSSDYFKWVSEQIES